MITFYSSLIIIHIVCFGSGSLTTFFCTIRLENSALIFILADDIGREIIGTIFVYSKHSELIR
jgi:hypothetical protein